MQKFFILYCMLSFVIAKGKPESERLEEDWKRLNPACSPLNHAIFQYNLIQYGKQGASLDFPGKTRAEIWELFKHCRKEWGDSPPSDK